jgi:hypothetical protein
MAMRCRSSRKQAKESRGTATMGGLAASASVIQAGRRSRPPFATSTIKWMTSA